MKYLLAISYFAAFAVFLRIAVRYNFSALIYGMVSLALICLAAFANDSFGLIQEKVASFVSYDMYKGLDFQLGFVVQYVLAWIPLNIFDYEYVAHGLNMGMQAFTFMLGAKYIFNLKPSWLLLVFMIFPSYYHYAIFGLRDPLINLIATFIVIGALHFDKRMFLLLCLLLAAVSVGIRPEFSMIIAGFAMLREFIDSSGRRRVVVGVLGLVGLYGALLVMPAAFGLPTSFNPVQNIESMTQFNELRNARRLGEDGSGSHILGGTLYSYPFIARYPIQVAASFLAPLPFDIRGNLDLIAFAESLLFCGVAFLALFLHQRNYKATLLFFFGVTFIMLQAIFAINYGNILRIRYPSLIFFLAAIVAATQNYTAKPKRSQRRRVRR